MRSEVRTSTTDVLVENWAPWPTPYRAETDGCDASEPRLSRHTILSLAPIVAAWFLADNQTFGLKYRAIVKKFRDAPNPKPNLICEYLPLIQSHFHAMDPRRGYFYAANEHDFANLHRAVWLLMLHALARLLNFNLHGDWGDPAGDTTTQGRYEDQLGTRSLDNFVSFHTTPNAYGSYAISSSDLTPPDLGVGDAQSPAASVRTNGFAADTRVGRDDSRKKEIAIGKALGRILVDRSTMDSVGQHPYHRVVKRYYFDHRDKTEEYARVLGDLLQPVDAELAAYARCIDENSFAEIHRCAWLFLTHRFSFVAGFNPFDVSNTANLPSGGRAHAIHITTEVGNRIFEVPNPEGYFTLNGDKVDPEPALEVCETRPTDSYGTGR